MFVTSARRDDGMEGSDDWASNCHTRTRVPTDRDYEDPDRHTFFLDKDWDEQQYSTTIQNKSAAERPFRVAIDKDNVYASLNEQSSTDDMSDSKTFGFVNEDKMTQMMMHSEPSKIQKGGSATYGAPTAAISKVAEGGPSHLPFYDDALTTCIIKLSLLFLQ